MIEEKVEVKTASGVSGGVFYRPEKEGRWPGVLHLTDAGGIRQPTQEMAQRLVAEGYCVLQPNIFYRTGTPPFFATAFRAIDEAMMKRFAELTGPVTPEAMESDAAAYVDFLTAQKWVRDGPIGAVGYCFSGAFALRAAAVRPDKVAAVASFHGGGLYTDAPTSPHFVLPRVKARLYFGHATDDRNMPQEAIDKFNQALESWNGEYESEVYEGAYHGWTASDGPVFNPVQADRAFQKLRELYAATLGSN